MTERTTYEKIQNTFNVYDPQRLSVCVGSAALALQFKDLGWERPVSDVDVLAPQAYIKDLNRRFMSDWVDGHAWADPNFQYEHMTDSGERKMSLIPKYEHKNDLLKFQAFTTIRDDHHMATYSDDLPTVNVGDIRCLDAREVLLWKAKIMRPTDKEAIEYTLLNTSIKERLGDTVCQLQEILSHNHQATPLHGSGCGCYTCFDL